MKDVKTYYDEKTEGYEEVFDTLYFRVFDAVTWKHLEPYVPADPEALVLNAGGGNWPLGGKDGGKELQGGFDGFFRWDVEGCC